MSSNSVYMSISKKAASGVAKNGPSVSFSVNVRPFEEKPWNFDRCYYLVRKISELPPDALDAIVSIIRQKEPHKIVNGDADFISLQDKTIDAIRLYVMKRLLP